MVGTRPQVGFKSSPRASLMASGSSHPDRRRAPSALNPTPPARRFPPKSRRHYGPECADCGSRRGTGMACDGEAEVLANRLARDRADSVENPHDRRGIELRHIALERRGAVHHRDAATQILSLIATFFRSKALLRRCEFRFQYQPRTGISRAAGGTPANTAPLATDGRHQFLKPAVRGQRPLERLLKPHDFVGAKEETDPAPSSSICGSLGRRTTSTRSLVFRRQTKKTTRRPKGPRMASMPLLSMVPTVYVAEQTRSRIPDVIGWKRIIRQARVAYP